jgi:uncharacterized alpha-E superfamily protein
MLSRVADSIYWLCRYIERAENVARFVDVNLNLNLGTTEEQAQQWEPLVIITGDHELFLELYDSTSKENVIQFLTFDERNPNSILSTLKYARENARTIREIISSEMWEQVNTFYLFVKDSSMKNGLEDMYSFYSKVKMASHLFTGITDTTMSHGEGWHFGRMGRLIERGDKSSRILDVKYYILLPKVEDVGTPLDNIQWGALLKSASAFEMYRKKHRRIFPNNVAEFLILDKEFPRSLRYCINNALESLYTITGTQEDTFSNKAEQSLGRLSSELDYTQIDEIMSRGLHEFLDDFQKDLNLIDDNINYTFFALKPSIQIMQS